MPDDEKRQTRETGEEAHAIPFLKRFIVFNVAQCDGLPGDLAVVAGLIKAAAVDFRIGGNRAFYAPSWAIPEALT